MKKLWDKQVQGTNMEMTTLQDCINEYNWGNITIIDGDKRRLDIIVDQGFELTSEQVEEQRLNRIAEDEALENAIDEFCDYDRAYERDCDSEY